MARRSQLEGRLLAILDSRRRRAALRRPVALAAAALTLAVLLPFAAVRAQEAVPSSPAELKQSVERAQAQGDAAALDRFAEALARTYHYHEAAEAASAALGLHARRSGENSVEYGRALLRLAGFTSHIGKDTETTQHYRRAVEILEPALGAASAELAPAFSYLGYRAQLDKNYDQAEAYYNRIPATAGVVARLAMIAEARGRMADAEAGYLRAMNMGDGQSTENAIALDYYAAILRQDPARAATAADFAGRAARIHQAAVQAIGAQAAPPLAGGPITPLRVGGGVTPPSLLFKIEPAYSETARLAKFQGTVVLYIVVGPDGVARDIRLVKGLGKGLDERAAEAITQWRFRPGQKDGQPVSVAATIEVNFRLL
jgi:TonB family protein